MNAKKYLTTILIFSHCLSFSQTKTYSGDFEDGVATYQYIENNDFERILNGSFSFKTIKFREGRGQCTIEATGKFKKNIKDGKWTYKVIGNDREGTMEIAQGSYVDGKLNGIWSLKNTEKNTNKIIRSSTVSFSNGRLVGPFYYIFNAYFLIHEYSFISIKGKFSKKGSYDSIWTIKYKNAEDKSREDVRKYSNGILFWRLYRDITTGDVIDRYDTLNYKALPSFDEGINSNPLDKIIAIWLNNNISGDDNVYDSPILISLFNKIGKNDTTYVESFVPNAEVSYAIKKIEESAKKERARIENKVKLEKKERENAAEEKRIAKEQKEHEKLRSFLKSRKARVFNLDSLSRSDFNKVTDEVIDMIHASVKDVEFKELNIGGQLVVSVDTANIVTVNTSGLTSNINGVLTEIKKKFSTLKFPVQKINNYTINALATIPMKVSCTKGTISFKIKKSNEIVYKSEPDENLIALIRKNYRIDSDAHNIGSYVAEYFSASINGKKFDRTNTVKYKLGLGGFIDYVQH